MTFVSWYLIGFSVFCNFLLLRSMSKVYDMLEDVSDKLDGKATHVHYADVSIIGKKAG